MTTLRFDLPSGFEFEGHELSTQNAVFNPSEQIVRISVFVDGGRRKCGWRHLSIPVVPESDLAKHLKNEILSGFAVSDTHSVNTAAMCGQGLIVGDSNGYPCSTGCAEQSDSDDPDVYSQVFAVVNHPGFGFMAVNTLEYWALGLPEFSGYPTAA